MANKIVEKQFVRTIREYTDNKFYVQTDEHSSGFNQIEIYDMEDGIYSVITENNCCIDGYLSFEEIQEEYPKFTLDKRLAFNGDFETWDRYEKAINGELEITILEI